MSVLSVFYRWITGNATAQRQGAQSTLPATTAHEDVPALGMDAALQVSTVWACVKLLVETVSSLPLFVYATDASGQRKLARGESLYTLLHDAPNSRHTAQEFWEFMLLNLFLRGNAYARVERNGRGEAYALWPLAADQVEVTALPGGKLVYAYRRDSETLIYDETQIFHVRGMGNGIVGMSPLDYMRASVGLAISAQNHTAAIYRKQARRPAILMSERVLTKEQREALRENFGEIATGGSRELYVLEGNMKYEPINMSPADIQLLETRRFAVEDLARWFGVPSVLINDTAKTTTWGTGVEQIIEGFYKFTLRPQLERIEQAIARRVLTAGQRARGLHAEFSFDALLRANMKDRFELYSKGVQNGITTRNECRQLENLPPVEGGDVLTAQVNLVPIDMLGQQDKQVAQAARLAADKSENFAEMRHKEMLAAVVRAEPAAPSVVNVTYSAPNVSVMPAEISIDNRPPEVHVAAPEVRVDVSAPSVTVEPAAVEVKVEAIMPEQPAPVVEVKVETPDAIRIAALPKRVTTSTVERDRDGNIIHTTQIEKDA